MAEVRPLILQLGQKITDRLGRKINENDPEYWGLNEIVTDEMAEVALKMDVRKPVTLPQLVKKTGKSAEYLEKLMMDMAMAGLIEYNWENPKHEKQYILPMYVPGSAEFTNMNQKQLEEHPKLGRFFERMSFEPLTKVVPMVPEGGAGIGMHVIPVEKAIEAENQSVSVEHISHWLDKYEGKYAASPCSCRLSRRTFDEGCADDPEDWCIGVGDMADYLVETKRGHYVTREKVMEILKHAEDNGFVHQITNIDGENKIFAICNCNVNVCYALRTSQLFNTPNLSRSAYVARTESDKCVACGRCVEYCPAGAVKLGQKLCKRDGSKVKYPKHILPDNHKWSEKNWDMNYRDTNRTNCYATGTAPCKTACPAHIGIQGYLKMASEGRYTEALELIKKENPFPAVCGRICNKRCESACTRGTIDQAIAIDEVKKFIAQKDLDAKVRFIPKKVIPSNRGEFEQKIAIIGGGPAGLSCAFYLAEKGYRPTVFERNKVAGGMLVYGIPSFKLEKDVVAAEIDVMREMGVEIKTGVEVGKDVTIQQLRDQGYKAFYIAIGCQVGRKAGVPGEDAAGVMTAVDFLRTVADNHDYKVSGKTVVVGGGNVAIDVSRTAWRCGGTEVQQFCLEQRNEMPATVEEIEEAEEEGIKINCGWGPKEILTEGGKVRGIVFKKCLSVKDETGRFNPKYDENDTMTVECENVFLSIGQAIVWGDMLAGTNVQLGRGNGVVADGVTYQTAEPDIFAGGDVYTGPKFAIDAIAAGKKAAVSIHRFVQPHSSMTIGRDKREFIELNKEDIFVQGYDDTPRQVPGKKTAKEVGSDFKETKVCFTEEQIKKETARCLSCGQSVVDENKCIGCGVCTTKCAFDAIHLHREHPKASRMIPSEDKLKAILPNILKREIKVLLNPNRNSLDK
ncbi:NADPH-dependent glutamate synthase [Treponema sp. JC4]|uniref:FAD-dependent oxidoreductase n=1 Tax=Treponema sp. JC4 TaxID=1124982 RepID=UPI00025AFD3C|nr:FAD-dependent oxidoreductase [Treponema sp. JC4]EID85137.1 NADPH-dependent glutamate synthase [Treponema sp. JC4]